MRSPDQPVVSEGPLVIRRMGDDLPDHQRMVRWRNEPHVREWWDPDDPPMTLEASRAEYGPLCQVGSSTTACIIEWEGQPAGYIQFYPWAAYPEDVAEVAIVVEPSAWGLDIFLGEPDLVGKGIGTAAVDALARYLFRERQATSVAFLVAKDNARALRAYEKAGFTRSGSALDTDTRNGQRVESWLMLRRGG
jgi:RimJ/RimL family protein N-acetyltransferase